MGDFFGISNQSDTDVLVQAYRDTQQDKLDTITQRKSTLEKRRTYFTTLNTKLTNLVNIIDDFKADDINNDFVTRKAVYTPNEFFDVSVDNTSTAGLNSAKVLRIATNDTLLSQRMNYSDAWTGPKSVQNFQLKVGDQSFDISVDLTDAETNEDAMREIAKAINATDDIKVSASYVQDTESTGRLSITAKDTGTIGAISFGSSPVIQQLGIDPSQITQSGESRTLATASSAGYRTSNQNELNSLMEVNGIEIERNSNSVTGVLEGITFNLKSPMEEDETDIVFDTTIDTKAVENLIQPFMNTYNDIMRYLNSDKEIRRSDPAVSSLQQRFRGVLSEAVSSVDSGNPQYLMELGIDVNQDGTIRMTDISKLEELLEDDPMKVAELFTSEDGIIAKFDNVISNYVGDDGLVISRRLSLSDQIDYQEKRYDQLESRINQEAENLRKQYTTYLETFFQAQSQFNLLATMPQQSGGMNSLLANSVNF